MKRREFVKAAAALPVFGSAVLASPGDSRADGRPANDNEVYEIRRYGIRQGRPQQDLENYFRDALIPALKRRGAVHVGVFSELSQNLPAVLFVLVAYPDVQTFYAAATGLADDPDFRRATTAFESKSSQDAVYSRYDTWVLRAFDGLKQMIAPDASQDRIFELRTYQGHNDYAVSRKVTMFDSGEIDIFYRTGLHPVFFGRMIAGPAMPALTYMLTFRDMAERDANWGAFGGDPDWNTIRVKPEFADTVSNIIRVFLKPTAYSLV